MSSGCAEIILAMWVGGVGGGGGGGVEWGKSPCEETTDVLLRCCYIQDANGEARSFRPRDRDEMVKQVTTRVKLIYTYSNFRLLNG